MIEAPAYAELHCLSNFSFLRGASSARELFERARAMNYRALAITDECSLAGIVRAFEAARETGLSLIVGSEMQLADGPTGAGPKIVLLVENLTGYIRLCELITRARRRSVKGRYRVVLGDFRQSDACVPNEGLLALWLPPHADSNDYATWLHECFPERAWLALELHHAADDAARLVSIEDIAARHALPIVATGDVHMHVRRRRALQDTVTAIRHRTTVAQAGMHLFANGERHLRSRAALAALYPQAALRETTRIAARCTFALSEIRYEYPRELVPVHHTATSWLRALTEEGARWRWPHGTPPKAQHLIEHELALISELGYESYFLTVHDIVRFARSQAILCQGRGSAANSAVCFALGITEIDPARMSMLFERFISRERNEPPDIDVDFEHERREEVIQYIYRRYGRERAALAATVICYRGKSAVRDVAKALGYSFDQVEQLSRVIGHWDGLAEIDARLVEHGFDPASAQVRRLVVLAREIMGTPRHLSQHVGGFVIAEQPLHTLVPVENAAMPDRTIIQWDKDDLDTLGLLKVDCLALGMLTCIRKCFDLLRAHHGIELTQATIPAEDPETYAMIQRADTVGVFQIESRAQMAMLPRLKPTCFYDLVIEVAIVRPGPIQGRMVHPYLRRRQGLEPVEYPADELRAVFERTLGVPLFQEQVMQLAIVAAGYSAGEADELRRSMAAWRRRGGLEHHRQRILEGMSARGYPLEFAEQVFERIKGFGSYGFPESHAASFALITYVSCWLKCHHPAAFACALLNSLPMGFYAPSQIIADVRRHGVAVRPVDVRFSDWNSTLEPSSPSPPEPGLGRLSPSPSGGGVGGEGSILPTTSFLSEMGRTRTLSLGPSPRGLGMKFGAGAQSGIERRCAGEEKNLAIRMGLREIRGLSEAVAERIVDARGARAFGDVEDLCRRAELDARARSLLARADALRGLAGDRHRAHWEIAGVEAQRPLFDAIAPTAEARVAIPPPTAGERVLEDYALFGLTLGPHPLALLRASLKARRCRGSREVRAMPHGRSVRYAGLVTMRQRPATASGVTFVTLEDEHGMVNVVVWRDLATRKRRVLREAQLLEVEGRVETDGNVQHLIAHQLGDLSDLLDGLDTRSRDFR
ncbi:MAG: error-prone DNA polymerase [Lysobacterales bacterium]